MNDDKEYGRDLCKNHSARLGNDFCRVCPSKLSKKELEDVYFSLLETNLDLKRTINSQSEKIKLLSTKIQRLSAVQKAYLGKEQKSCCTGSKAVINDQRECIAELKRSNQLLAERIRMLNMRLCSAKQFLKRSPFQSTSRCHRCSNKNSSMSALNTKRSESNLRTAVASSQYLDKEIVTSRTGVNNVASHEIGVQYEYCEENKCRTQAEELQQKVVDLQEELSSIHADYGTRISQLERELVTVREESLQARSQRTAAEERLEARRGEAEGMGKRLAEAQLQCDDLLVQLAVEKRRVAELEMRVRSADMSSRIATAIETHLTNIKVAQLDSTKANTSCVDMNAHVMPEVDGSPGLVVPSPSFRPQPAVRTKMLLQVDDSFKNSDDSGYTEVNRSHHDTEDKTTHINQLLLEKIADLQNQINNLKASKNEFSIVKYNKTESGIPDEKAKDGLNDKEKSNKQMIVSENDKCLPVFKEKLTPNITIHELNSDIASEQNAQSIHLENYKSDDKLGKKDCESDSEKDSSLKSKVYSTENKLNKIDESDKTHDTNKNRESFKTFKRRSKEKSIEKKKLSYSRKSSIEISKQSRDENVVETRYTDEKVIPNTDNISTFNGDTKGTEAINNSIQTNKTNKNTDISPQLESPKDDNKLNRHNKCTTQVSSGKNITQINQDKNINIEKTSSIKRLPETKSDIEGNITKEIKDAGESKDSTHCEIDSDSSNGTYSIHRDVTVTKNTNVQPNAENMKVNPGQKDIVGNADMKKKCRRKSKDKLKRGSSTPSQPGTYVVNQEEGTKARIKPSHFTSPNSTDCEISSLSDLPSENDSKMRTKYQSPGEVLTTTFSESRTDTTTDYGSLSEGELPCVADGTLLSAGERPMPKRALKSNSLPPSPSQQMEEALRAVNEELSRCTKLLNIHRQRSLDGLLASSDKAKV